MDLSILFCVILLVKKTKAVENNGNVHSDNSAVDNFSSSTTSNPIVDEKLPKGNAYEHSNSSNSETPQIRGPLFPDESQLETNETKAIPKSTVKTSTESMRETETKIELINDTMSMTQAGGKTHAIVLHETTTEAIVAYETITKPISLTVEKSIDSIQGTASVGQIETKADSTLVQEHTREPIENYKTSTELITSGTKYPSEVHVIRSESKQDYCPEISKSEIRETLVLCTCGIKEILSDTGECVPYDGDMIITLKEKINKSIEYYEVITEDLQCDDQTLVHFTEEQFKFHPYKDNVIVEDPQEELNGLIIDEYCINYQQNEDGNITLALKGCVKYPAVPRCCPFGQSIKDGSCQTAKTPIHLTPPIFAVRNGNDVNWEKVTTFTAPIKCPAKDIKFEALPSDTGQLILFTDGVQYLWQDPSLIASEVYRKCGEFCVDGIAENKNNVEYSVYFCYLGAAKHHKQVCGDKKCFRKCCRDGEAVMTNEDKPQCARFEENHFNFTKITNLTSYNIVHGFPLCNSETMYMERVDSNFHIDNWGIFRTPPPPRPSEYYCADLYIDKGIATNSSYICSYIRYPSDIARNKIFPYTFAISTISLAFIVSLHIMIPRMKQNGGLIQLFHAIFLGIAYLTNFISIVFDPGLSSPACEIIAIMKQFGYLGSYFWLNVVCFALWRTTRSLKNLMSAHRKIPAWAFMVYAIGAPLCICLITLLIHLLADEETSGLFMPGIGTSICFFEGNVALVLYFYGFIALLFAINIVFIILTFIDHRQLMRKYKENITYLKKEGNVGEAPQKRTNASAQKVPKCVVDHMPEFTQKMRIFILCVGVWMTEIFAFIVRPKWMWLPTDIFNTLQGLVLFFIMIGNRNKRKLLRKKFPKISKMADHVGVKITLLKKRLCSTLGISQSNNDHGSQHPALELVNSISSISVSSVNSDTITTSIESLDE